MKLFLLIAFCFPFLSFAGLTTGDEFLVDEGDINSRQEVSSSSSSSSQYFDNEDSQSIGSTGGYEATQQGGLQGTNQGQSSGSAVQALGAAMGAGFSAACFSCSPSPCWGYCAMAAQSFLDAGAGAGAASAAVGTGSYLDTSYGQNTGSDTAATDLGTSSQIEEGLSQLQSAGVNFNADGSVTTPDGNTFAPGDFASEESMVAKGISPNTASQMASTMSDIKNEAAKEAGIDLQTLEAGDKNPYSGGNGAPSVTAPVLGAEVASVPDTYIEEVEYRGKKKKKDRLPASQAAELSKTFKGEPIGIGMANLFLIVHKKYKKNKKAKAFFTREY